MGSEEVDNIREELTHYQNALVEANSELATKDAEIERLKVEHAHECAKVSQRDREIEELKAQLSARDQQAGNVLARVHRDGGHYITQHGWEKACVDADAVVCRLQAQLSASEEKRKQAVSECLSWRKIIEHESDILNHENTTFPRMWVDELNTYVRNGCGVLSEQMIRIEEWKEHRATMRATDIASALEAP